MSHTGPRVVREVSELVSRVRLMSRPGSRIIIGITGEPGAGKTTLAAALVEQFPNRAKLAGMDGFHLAQHELERLGRAERKGAADTFDSWGYLALLKRLKARDEPVVYAPTFDRSLEEPIGSAVSIGRDIEIIFTEGNYLLLDTEGWREVAPLLDEIWYIEPDPDVRMRRLIERHISYGKSRQAAVSWAHGSDEHNAALVREHRSRADIVIHAG